jgi:glycosyltransferase involved in cell wall biosynthesis
VAFFCKAFNLLYSSLYCGVVESCWFLLKNGVDIVHLNNGFLASREWAIAAKMLGIRCVSNLMGFAKGSIQSRFTAKLLDAVMPCSEAVKQDMIEKGINCRRNVVVYLAIPDAFFGSWPGTIERVEGRLPEKGPSIGIIGNIKPWKGQRVVIEALALLKSKYPTLRCLFVGDTPRNANGYLEEIKAFIAENGLEENAVFMGYQRDIPKIVAEIDIVVHASIEPEPLGLVIIEGMAMGKAVIATDIGGPREIIMSGETGLLVSPNNPRELAAAIEHLLSDPIKAKEMGKRARQDAETRFRVGEYARQIERVYEDVLSSNRVARFQGGIG